MVELAIFHCKCRFGNVRMPTRTPLDLDMYLEINQRQMKTINAKYNVIMKHWASKNNVQEYKVYATIIWMCDLDFVNNLRQAPRDNSWLVELTNRNYKTCLLHQAKYLLGMNGTYQYLLVEAACKNWPENGSDLDDNMSC
jgi:hypothetical protein